MRTGAANPLSEALRAGDLNDLDERIGPEAVSQYEERLAAARLDGSDAIIDWWKKQPANVTATMLAALRKRWPDVVAKVENETRTRGIELLEALVRDDGPDGGRRAYELEIMALLNAAAGSDDAPQGPPVDPIATALAGLTRTEIIARFGHGATSAYVERVTATETDAAFAIVNAWQQRGDHFAVEWVITLHWNPHSDAVDDARRLIDERKTAQQ